jgi:hypothetical protein
MIDSGGELKKQAEVNWHEGLIIWDWPPCVNSAPRFCFGSDNAPATRGCKPN